MLLKIKIKMCHKEDRLLKLNSYFVEAVCELQTDMSHIVQLKSPGRTQIYTVKEEYTSKNIPHKKSSYTAIVERTKVSL